MPEMIVIDDNNYTNWLSPIVGGERKLTGYEGFWLPEARASAQAFEQLEEVPLIPENEWDDRIDQRERDGATLKQFCQDNGLFVLDQNGTNYCWINCVAFAMMIIRLQETGRCMRLSPASAGAPIKSFSNKGGWSSQGLDFCRVNGMNEQGDWPPNAISRQYYTEANKEKAKKHVIIEYFKLNGWEEVGSCLLAGIPVAVGLSWWSHAICYVGIKKGPHNAVFANSWGRQYSDDGYGELAGSKKMPDDACAIVSMVAA